MASATGIPEQRVATSTEDEPLLGRPGDASQQEGQGLQYNFVLGRFRSRMSLTEVQLNGPQVLACLPKQAYGSSVLFLVQAMTVLRHIKASCSGLVECFHEQNHLFLLSSGTMSSTILIEAC
jgi:hypothetical protein